jgi:hypothetical protein
MLRCTCAASASNHLQLRPGYGRRRTDAWAFSWPHSNCRQYGCNLQLGQSVPQRRTPMYGHAGKSAGGALASAIYLAGGLSFSAMAQGAPPNFAPNASIGWYAYNRQFIPPPSGPSPVQQDPARPYVSNDEFRVTGRQPTEQLADLDNPILQPWARDVCASATSWSSPESRLTPRTRVAGPSAFPVSCSDP